MTDTVAGPSRPVQHIHGARGAATERSLSCTAAPPPARVPSIAGEVPVTRIMSRQITCARRELGAQQLVELVVNDRVGCVPVVEDPGRPVGMITKLDLLESLLTADTSEERPRVPSHLRTANDVMMPLAITLGEHASVAHAAAIMATEDIHHVAIVDAEGRMVGLVSSMDVVRWLADNDGLCHSTR